MADCLEVANEVWSDLFIGKEVRQVEYNADVYTDDSRTIMRYRSAAVTQIAVALFQDARAPESVELTELGEIKCAEGPLPTGINTVPLLKPVPPRPKKGESK